MPGFIGNGSNRAVGKRASPASSPQMSQAASDNPFSLLVFSKVVQLRFEDTNGSNHFASPAYVSVIKDRRTELASLYAYNEEVSS